MLTRTRRQRLNSLLEAYEEEQETVKKGYGRDDRSHDSSDAQKSERMYRRMVRAAIKERRLLSLRRTLRYGEIKRIVELRFLEVSHNNFVGKSN